MNTTPFDLIELITGVDLPSVVSPSSKVAENETIVGQLSDTNKRLWHLLNQATDALEHQSRALQEKSDAHMTLHESAVPEEHDCAAYRSEITAGLEAMKSAAAYANCLKSIFWSAVRLQFPEIQTKPSIGVRDNFTVVWTKSDDEEGGPGVHVVHLSLGGGFGPFGDLVELLRR